MYPPIIIEETSLAGRGLMENCVMVCVIHDELSDKGLSELLSLIKTLFKTVNTDFNIITRKNDEPLLLCNRKPGKALAKQLYVFMRGYMQGRGG
jgi:hypothetical protein